MTSLLPPLHDGHAPIYLHHAFHAALDAYEDWTPGADEPSVNINGKTARISVVFRRLWRCSDTIPNHTLDALRDIIPATQVSAEHWETVSTYSAAAQIMRRAYEYRKQRRLPVVIC